MSAGPVAVIAGSGRLPFMVTEGIQRAGRKVVVLAFRGTADPALKALADDYAKIGVVRVGGWIRAMKRRGITEAVMVGGVKKRDMYLPWKLLTYLPDLRTIRLWYDRAHADRSDETLLNIVANDLSSEGIELVSHSKYCEEHLAHEGVMTRKAVPDKLAKDVEFGWKIARASAGLDIGQSLAVKDGSIIAVEAMEGTDGMIHRAGELCRKGKWTMVKVARPHQDMRLDVPTIGPDTLRNLKAAKCICLVVEAERTLIVDKPDTLALADELGIAVMGRRAEPAPPAESS